MNWSKFPPSILALGKGYAIVLSVAFGSIKTVNVGIRTYDSFTGATNTTLKFPQESPTVQYMQSSEPCPTCLHVDMGDGLLEYHGRALNANQVMPLAFGAPHMIGASPLTITYTTTHDDTGTSTNAVRSHKPSRLLSGTFWFEVLLFCWDMLISCLMSPTYQTIFRVVNAATSRAMLPQQPAFWLVILQRLASMLLSWPVTTWFKLLRRNLAAQQRAEAASSTANAQLATETDDAQNAVVEKWAEIFHEYRQDPAAGMSAIRGLLADNASDENAKRAEWQMSEQRRLSDIAAIRNNEILESEKRKINRIANKSFKTLRKAQKEKLMETYEQDVFATADIEPSFGPSLRNAEVEIRNQLRPLKMTENLREDLTGMFKTILYSFTYAIAVQESLSGERHARYLTVIDGQNCLIEALRLLHKHREKAYAENESLVKLLCRYDKAGKLQIPAGEERSAPFDKYVPKDDEFILSPLDGPAALSMKVSITSAGLQSRPDAQLDSDPHWQRFLNSTDRKAEEQEARHASAASVPMEDHVQVTHGVQEENTHPSSQIDEDEHLNSSGSDRGNGIKDASEDNHHDEEIAAALRSPHENHSQQSKNIEFPKEDETKDEGGIKDVAEQDQSGGARNGESILDRSGSTKPTLLQDHFKHGAQHLTGRDVSDLKWQIRYLKAGYGTPDDPWAKPYSDATPPVTSEGLTGDEALARELWVEELSTWRKDRIQGFKKELSEQEIANLGVNHGSGDTGSDNDDVGNGDSQNQSDPCTDLSTEPHEAEHQPKEPSKTEKRRAQRKLAKAKQAEKLLDSNNDA